MNKKIVGILVAIMAPHFQRKLTTLTLNLFGLDKLHPHDALLYIYATTSYSSTC